MIDLVILGMTCYLISGFGAVVMGYRHLKKSDSEERIDFKRFYRDMNLISILSGIGSVAMVYNAILEHSFLQIAINTLPFVMNIYFFWERNLKNQTE